MRHIAAVTLLFVLAWTAPVWAELVNCGTPAQFFRQYADDPTHVTDPVCTVIPKPTTPEQRQLYDAQQALVEQFRAAGTLRYLKVEGGLVVEKTPTEKADIDAQITASQALATTFTQELQAQELCNALTLDDLTARIAQRRATRAQAIHDQHAATLATINALTTANLTTLKDGLKAVNDALAQGLGALNDREAEDLTILARCLRAARGGAR